MFACLSGEQDLALALADAGLHGRVGCQSGVGVGAVAAAAAVILDVVDRPVCVLQSVEHLVVAAAGAGHVHCDHASRAAGQRMER